MASAASAAVPLQTATGHLDHRFASDGIMNTHIIELLKIGQNNSKIIENNLHLNDMHVFYHNNYALDQAVSIYTRYRKLGGKHIQFVFTNGDKDCYKADKVFHTYIPRELTELEASFMDPNGVMLEKYRTNTLFATWLNAIIVTGALTAFADSKYGSSNIVTEAEEAIMSQSIYLYNNYKKVWWAR